MAITYGVSEQGNMSYSYGAVEDVAANRRAFFGKVGVDPEKVVFSRPSHGTRILTAGPADAGRWLQHPKDLPEADIIFIPEPGLFAAFNPADCLTITLFDGRLRRVMHIHAGFAGVDAGIVEIGLSHMLSQGSRIQDLVVRFGPALQAEHFTVKKEYADRYPSWSPFYQDSGDGEYPIRIDYVGRAYAQLLERGIPAERILNPGRDTYADPSLFSDSRHGREDAPAGRFMVLAGYEKE